VYIGASEAEISDLEYERKVKSPFYFHDWLLIKRKWPYLDPTALYKRKRAF